MVDESRRGGRFPLYIVVLVEIPLLQPLPLPITPFIAAFRVGFSFCPAMPLSYFYSVEGYVHISIVLLVCTSYYLVLYYYLYSYVQSLLMHNLLEQGQQALPQSNGGTSYACKLASSPDLRSIKHQNPGYYRQ